MVFTGKVKKRRKAPSPNSILDRKALQEALDEKGIAVKKMHIDAFYQALHRQHYPSLQQFVETYYMYERNEEASSVVSDENDKGVANAERPLKNKITSKKNKNRSQLPKVLLEYVASTKDFVTVTSRIKEKMTSRDNSTTKLIIQLWDDQVVESVIMRYERKASGRASLCVSSQCGCAMGCTFCATGTMGLSGNLTTGEILEQLVHANRILADEHMQREDKSKKIDLVRNVVMMGMGEPLDNYNNVVGACRAMMDRKRWNLAHGRVTVSTVGLVSQIRKLTADLPEVGLALSLHAPNQEARVAIVPTAARYPIEQLIDALDGHMMAYLKKRVGEDYTQEERLKESGRRRAMIEYIMLTGETSSFECAHQLGKLCENRQLIVNLIPYNATDVKDKLQCPSDEHMLKFKEIVCSYGTFCTVRRTMGADIAGACGQLVKAKQDGEVGNDNDAAKKQVDIEDVVPDKSSVKPRSAEVTANSSEKSGDLSSKQERPIVSKAVGWLANLSITELDSVGNALTVASTAVAAYFVVSSLMFYRRR